MRVNKTPPQQSAGHIGSIDTSTNASTDWTDVVSTDVQDSKTGSAMPAGLQFISVGVRNTSATGSAYIKLRARGGAADPVAAEIEIPATAAVALPIAATAGDVITTIAYKKAAAGDELIFLLGLSDPTI